jgi:GNAT superfamily N-acetyltransferase
VTPGAPTLAAGAWTLRQAGPQDFAALVALQHAAYAKNRERLGVEPIPLLADYRVVRAEREVWVLDGDTGLRAALILEPQSGCLLIESIATDPAAQGQGLGRALLAAAETRAQELGCAMLRLFTGAPLVHLIAWYARHGYSVERREALRDREIVHMVKHLRPGQEELPQCRALPPI